MNRWIIILFLTINFHADAQRPNIEHEIGLGVGVGNYYGDLNTRFDYQGMAPAATIFWKGNYGYRFALKTALSHTKVHYQDAYSSSAYQRQRNLSFQSNITDLSASLEFNFLKYVKNVYYNIQGSQFTPYIQLGTGIFFYNPQANINGKMIDLQPLGTEGQTDPSYSKSGKYNLFNWSINYGGGFKMHIYRNLSAGIDFTIHRALTDYIDDVSGTYPAVINLPDANKGIAYQLYDRSKELGTSIAQLGKQRGSNNGNDDFVFLTLQLSWTLFSKKCPSDIE